MARRELKLFRVSLDLHDEGFKELLRLAVPTMISASIVQLNTIIVTNFTGSFKDGIIQSLNQAKTIWMLPYGIFAVAVGSVMLPSLSAHFAGHNAKEAKKLLGKSLRNALFLTIPSAGLLLILRVDVVQAIFKWKPDYSTASRDTTALILMGYCLAIVAQTIVFIYNQAFYAIGKTKVPLLIGVLSMAITTVLCLMLKMAGLLTETSVMGALGLSLAYSAASIVSATVLMVMYSKNSQLAPRNIGAFLVRTVICLAVLILVVSTLNVLPMDPQSKIGQLVWLFIRAGAGFGGYLVAARAMQMKELSAFSGKLMRLKNRSRK